MEKYSHILAGKLIKIEIHGLNVNFWFTVDRDGFNFFDVADRPADTTISATPLSLMRMLANDNRSNLLFDGDAEIRGDTDTAQQLNEMFNALDVDWEEHLSRFTGDIIAHQIGRAARGGRDWCNRSAAGFEDDVTNYLQEEKRLLPTRREVETFLSHVDVLRGDVERLEQRIARLAMRTTGFS